MNYLKSKSNNVDFFKKSLALIFIAGFVSIPVFAQDAKSRDSASAKASTVVIETFGARFAAVARAPVQQARVLIYRQGPFAKSEPINIYLNGRFHTALLKGGYSEFCAQPGPMVSHAIFADAQKQHTGRLGVGQTWAFENGKTLFLKVQEPGGLTSVAMEQAQREMAETALQVHMVSRSSLAQDCQEPAPAPAPAVAALPPPPALPSKPAVAKSPVPRLYALETDALFEFGKSELRAKSYNTIERMAQVLKQDFSEVERIRVVGHSDPIGQAKFNQKLSLERAKVVAQQLKERGVKPVKGFQIEGEGSRDLVKAGCGNVATPKNKLCHAPNRRVDIVVTGAKR